VSRIASLVAILLFSAFTFAETPAGPLMQQPSISSNAIVFAYAGEIWKVPRQGGEAVLMTSGSGTKSSPIFSPDGRWIAFTGDYEGNVDAYLMPASGGVPRRLTHHPAIDEVTGWTPDSRSVLFRSSRNSYSRFNRLFTVSVDGGLPHEIALPTAEEGAFSPDGSHLAYVPVSNTRRLHAIAWKRYRGGKASRIWIAQLSDSSVEQLPREDWNDSNPIWVGGKIYFLSDRSGPTTLYSYDPRSKETKQLVRTDGDIKSAGATSDAIVYEQFGTLHVVDLASGQDREVNVQIHSDLPQVRPHFVPANDEISNFGLSPSGARAVFEAHGEILTAPREKGDVRNLTNTPGSAERDPAWSPNGKWIAYFSDESGEYELHLRQPDGMGMVTKIKLEEHPSFYYKPVWSPDSTKIAFTDKRLNLWYVDVDKKIPVKVDTDRYDTPERTLDPTWSPDTHWIAYTKQLKSFMTAVFLYSIDKRQSFQVTDGLSDARFPVFDKGGKYLYFVASTNSGPTKGWLDLSSAGHSITSSAYLVVLSKDELSPLAHENDEEKGPDAASDDKDETASEAASSEPHPRKGETKEQAEDREAAAKKKPVVVTIDFENLNQRILALPMPARNYVKLETGTEGTLFLGEAPENAADDDDEGEPPLTIYRFDLKKRKDKKVLDGAESFTLSFNGKRMLYAEGKEGKDKWYIVDADKLAAAEGGGEESKKEQKPLDLASMQVMVDPRAEWKQEYNEVWRIERDFFYDPNLHGVNYKQAREHYAPYVENLGSRADFNYILEDMLGELTVGHLYIRSPKQESKQVVKTGLLGADYTIENGRYRFSRIYKGENWNPKLRAPLTEPGVVVHTGDYLLAINGRELKGTDEVFEPFQGTADKSVVLRVGPDPTGKGARDVTVTPIASETNLRNRGWIDDNRAEVDKLSHGRLAYIYLPDTGGGGFTSFNRYFFAQVGREGAVIDERFNGGGAAADYVIDYLRRPVMSYWMTREGEDFTTPVGAIFGPKAMIINGYAGSGGDALPWYFREAKLGPLVGTRTWGGLIGIYDYPQLMDGGSVTAPRLAFYSPSGKWEVENHGVAPDVDLELDPHAWRDGHDPQLEKAVDLVLKQLDEHLQQWPKHPQFPNYHMQTAGKPSAEPAKSGNHP
jgi:tricorn protease